MSSSWWMEPTGQPPTSTLIDICIPTFREESYIITTLEQLQKQTLFQKSHVWIGDYDPDGSGLTTTAIESLRLPNISIINVQRPGIGIARKMCTEAGRSPYIVTFDADTHFQKHDALEWLIAPIIRGEADATHAGAVMDTSESQTDASAMLYHARNEVAKLVPIVVYEQGFTFPRKVYDAAGGWRDVKSLEAPLLALDMMTHGFMRIKYIDNVTIVTSARRFGTALDLDYSHAFRDGKIHEVK